MISSIGTTNDRRRVSIRGDGKGSLNALGGGPGIGIWQRRVVGLGDVERVKVKAKLANVGIAFADLKESGD